MSDGPHRSLPMRRAWRGLAMRADNGHYSDADLASLAMRAVKSDFKNEVLPALVLAIKGIFSATSNSLKIREIALNELKAVEHLAAASNFGASFYGWAVYMATEGRLDRTAFYEAVGNAALERAHNGFRQVTEHYLRESTQKRASKITARLEKASHLVSVSDVGKQLIDPKNSPRTSLRHLSVDDGVPIHGS